MKFSQGERSGKGKRKKDALYERVRRSDAWMQDYKRGCSNEMK